MRAQRLVLAHRVVACHHSVAHARFCVRQDRQRGQGHVITERETLTEVGIAARGAHDGHRVPAAGRHEHLAALEQVLDGAVNLCGVRRLASASSAQDRDDTRRPGRGARVHLHEKSDAGQLTVHL